MAEPNRVASPPAVVIALAVAAAVLAVPYFAAISGYWNISPDSATYVGFAKALASGHWPAARPPQPPMTSVLYAPVLALFPDSYLALNVLARILMAAALGFFYALIARRNGPVHAWLVVVLTLASVSFYHASTQLLSEPAYMVFSGAALLLLDGCGKSVAAGRGAQRRVLESYAAGVLMILAVMTRTIGIALPMAVLFTLALPKRAAPGGIRGSRTVLVVFALLSFLAVVLWDVMVMKGSYAGHWVARYLLAPSVAHTSKVAADLELLPTVGAVLMNVRAPGDVSAGLTFRIAATAVFAVGLILALRRSVGVTEIYTAIFVAVGTLATVLTAEPDHNRLVLPAIPLIFTFVLQAVDDVFHRLERRGFKPLSLLVHGGLAAYVVCYAALGIRASIEGAREAHSSPFGSYPIKRAGNYDAQRIALWLKANSQPTDRYAATQRDMYDVLTERRGADIVPDRTRSTDDFLDWLERERVRYLLVDQTTPAVRGPVLAAIRAHPSRFRILLELPRASLYEVNPR